MRTEMGRKRHEEQSFPSFLLCDDETNSYCRLSDAGKMQLPLSLGDVLEKT